MRAVRTWAWRRAGGPFLIGSALGITASYAHDTFHPRASWHWWPAAAWSATGALIVLGLVAAASGERRSGVSALSTDAATQAAERLRQAVGSFWKEEAVLRLATPPAPLPVRWSSTSRPSASRAAVTGEPGATWRDKPLRGDASGIVAAFGPLRHKQLMILGEAGAGKTILAMLLTVGLIDDQKAAGQPVPVLLPVASWDAAAEDPRVFIARMLRAWYPFLAAPGPDGRDLASALMSGKMILPVLDGLDELPAGERPGAMLKLARFAAAGWPAVVTCRSRDYEEAVDQGGSILPQAAVIEIEPVDVEQAIACLTEADRDGGTRWQPVTGELRQRPAGPLASVLSTPLMVALARDAYRDQRGDPGELLARPDAEAIAGTLIDGFVASAYPRDPAPPAGDGPRRGRHADPDRAARWLAYLAYHLDQAGTRDLWWWQLRPGLVSRHPRLSGAVGQALVVGVAGAVTGSITAASTGGDRTAVWAGLTAMVAAALPMEPVFRHLWPGADPRHAAADYAEVTWVSRLSVWMFCCLALGTMTGLTLGAPWPFFAYVLTLAAAPGVAVTSLRNPVDLRMARIRHGAGRVAAGAAARRFVIFALGYGAAGGVFFEAAAALAKWHRGALAVGWPAVAAFGLTAGFAQLWPRIRYWVTRAQLAACGRLPWRLSGFLADAHLRGVLRRGGISWQFRHALLQDHLAGSARIGVLTRVADGDWTVAMDLDDLLARRGDMQVLRERASAGDHYAASCLAGLLVKAGRHDDAFEVLRPHPGDDSPAERELTQLLASGQQVAPLRAWAGRGGWYATMALIDMLGAQGELGELAALADGGSHRAALRLAEALTARGREDEAVGALAPHAADDAGCAVYLADLLLGQDRTGEAISVLRGNPDLAVWQKLCHVLSDAGDVAELRPMADREDSQSPLSFYASVVLARLLAAGGEDGIRELRERAGAGDRSAGRELSALEPAGGPDPSVATGREGPAAVEGPAGAWSRAERLKDSGNEEELRRLAADGDSAAACALADLLAAGGDVDAAIGALWPHAGEELAGRYLADLLVWQGRAGEGIATLRHLADAGSASAASRLADLLAEHGGLPELHSRAGTGDPYAAERLAAELAARGERDLLWSRVRRGDRLSAGYLATWHAERGDIDQAVAVLRASGPAVRGASASWQITRRPPWREPERLRLKAAAGSSAAAAWYAGLLVSEGSLTELERRAGEDPVAAGWLAGLLSDGARLGGTIAALRRLAGAGHGEAAEWLRRLSGET